MITESTKVVTDDTFGTEVLEADKVVLVDFWAPWCGPCRQVAPVLEEIAKEHGETLTVVKLNTDENPKVSAQYGITSIPTLNVYKGGELVKSIIGAKPKQILVRELSDWLA
jgi:thioredoxin 1